MLAYVLAPDAMVGWIRPPSPAEKEFLAAPVRDLPEIGRLTGRGDTVSLERLLAAKPDLVLDFGSTTRITRGVSERAIEQPISSSRPRSRAGARARDPRGGDRRGRLAAHGPPAEIVTGEMLSAIYGVPVSIEHTPSGRVVIVPIVR